MNRALVILSVLLGCGSTDDATEHVDAFRTNVEALREVTTAHSAAVAAAATVEDVTALEDAHATAWTAAMVDMNAAMTELDECMMDDDAPMSDAMTRIDDMNAAVDAHRSEHAGHTDVADCVAAETTHGAMMTSHFDAMDGDADDMMSGGMTCDHMGT